MQVLDTMEPLRANTYTYCTNYYSNARELKETNQRFVVHMKKDFVQINKNNNYSSGAILFCVL